MVYNRVSGVGAVSVRHSPTLRTQRYTCAFCATAATLVPSWLIAQKTPHALSRKHDRQNFRAKVHFSVEHLFNIDR